jgi:hypothetical protein
MTNWTADDLAKLDRAIASGHRRVKYAGGMEVEYQDVDGMLAARSVIAAALQTAGAGAAGSFDRSVAVFESGY